MFARRLRLVIIRTVCLIQVRSGSFSVYRSGAGGDGGWKEEGSKRSQNFAIRVEMRELERLTVEAYKDVSSLNITTRLIAIDLNDDVFSQSMA